MNKKTIFLIIAGVWLILLLGFLFYKEYTVQTGEKVLLQTIPVDPRDMFRGDYVVLSYPISQLTDSGVVYEPGDTVYANLQKQGEYYEAVASAREPGEGIWLRGTVQRTFDNSVSVEYGIESYFVPEGEGRVLERMQRNGTLDVEVAVDNFGNGVITGLYHEGEKI